MEKSYLENCIKKELSTNQIAKDSGKGQTTVRYWLKKYKLSTNHVSFTKKEFIGNKAVCKKHGLTEYTQDKIRCKKCLSEAVSNSRKNAKTKAIQYKGGSCIICGYNKYNGALEFHHLDPNEKDFHISLHGQTMSWEKYKKELDKCVLLCANCHREVHANMVRLP